MSLTERERIYDEELSPLMTKIIEVCREHDIPLVFSCQLNDDRVGDADVDEEGEPVGPFFCTTFIVPEDSSEKMKKGAAVLKPDPPTWWEARTVTTDENGNEHTEVVAGSEIPETPE